MAVGAGWFWILGPVRGHLKQEEPNNGGAVVSGVSGAAIGNFGHVHRRGADPTYSVDAGPRCWASRLPDKLVGHLVAVSKGKLEHQDSNSRDDPDRPRGLAAKRVRCALSN